MMPLTMANVGEPVTIKRIGGKEETQEVSGKSGLHGWRNCHGSIRRSGKRYC